MGISFAPPFGGMKFGLCADQYTSVLHSKLIQWTPHIILCGTVICMCVCVYRPYLHLKCLFLCYSFYVCLQIQQQWNKQQQVGCKKILIK